MRRWINFLCHLALFGALTSFVTFSSTKKIVDVPEALKVVEEAYFIYPQLEGKAAYVSSNLIFLGDSYLGFRESLAFKESKGDLQYKIQHGVPLPPLNSNVINYSMISYPTNYFEALQLSKS